MFRGFDPERDRLVAIKVFRVDLPPERVHRLVEALQRLTSGALKHPAIAAPIAAGIQENTAYLVQEYVAADSLDVVLREQGPAPPADALRVALQLASAIDAGVAHGAIHPRDIMLSHHDARMTGFGIAPALEQVGVTPPTRRPYTAPERMAGAAWDRRADIFSLAAVMCEVLTGKRIVGTGEQAARAVGDLRGVDGPALVSAFARALAENPDDRFDTAGAFAEAMAAAIERRTPTAIHASPPAATPADGRPPLGETDLPLQAAAGDESAGREDLELVVPPAPPSETAHVPAPTPSRATSVTPTHRPRPRPRLVSTQAPPKPTPVPDARRTTRPESRRQVARPPIRPAPPKGVEDPAPNPPPAPPVEAPPMLLSALDRSRSAMWPLALALVVGLGLGIPVGFGLYPVLNQAPEQPAVPAATGAARALESPAAPASQQTAPAGAATVPPQAPAPPPTSAPVAVRPAPARLAAAAPAGNPGRLLVRSTPGGARVFVDGRQHGVTPAELGDLALGTYAVRVVRDGYQAVERRVTITSAHPSNTVALTLTHLPPPPPPAVAAGTGSLLVESLPTGATVFLDERLIGTTPMSIPNLATGEHVVRMEMDGYQPWSTTTTVTAKGDNRVAGSLER